MHSSLQLSLSDAWREHALGSVNWDTLKSVLPFDEMSSIVFVLDLYVGGRIRHKYVKAGEIQCDGCDYLDRDPSQLDQSILHPACECHLGIVNAVVEGILQRRYSTRQIMKSDVCVIIIQANK